MKPASIGSRVCANGLSLSRPLPPRDSPLLQRLIEWRFIIGRVPKTSFTLRVTPPPPSDVAVRGDFNRDGLADIVFQDRDGALAAWLMNGANLVAAGFLEPSNIGDSRYSIVASGDFNGDKLEDLLFQHADGTLAVWFMDHTRMTESAPLIPDKPENAQWRALAVADFSGDGKPDLVLQHSNGTIEVWVMDGIRRVRRASLSERGTDGSWRIAGAADFNSDGKPDLVFQHPSGDLAVWYLDNFVASGKLLNPVNSGSPGLRAVSVADRNGDGKADLLFQHDGDGSLVLWLMNGINRSSVQSLNPSIPGSTWKVVAPK